MRTTPRDRMIHGGSAKRCRIRRVCPVCSKIVCSYKNPRAENTLCYSCDDEMKEILYRRRELRLESDWEDIWR